MVYLAEPQTEQWITSFQLLSAPITVNGTLVNALSICIINERTKDCMRYLLSITTVRIKQPKSVKLPLQNIQKQPLNISLNPTRGFHIHVTGVFANLKELLLPFLMMMPLPVLITFSI